MQLLLPVSLLITTLLLALVLFLYYKLQKKYIELVKHEERLSRSTRVLRRTRKKANQILEEARQNAQQIIQDTNLKAQEIISKSQEFSNQQNNVFLTQIKAFENQQVDSYKEFLQKLKTDSINLLNNITNDITSETKQDVVKLQGSMDQRISEADQSISKVISEGIQRISSTISVSQQQAIKMLEDQKGKADQEIEVYKKVKMEQVNEKIFDIIQKVTKDFIEKSLNPKEHEDVVYKSLEKAKNDNLFQ